ncbi:hypothetical protein [Haloferax marisrubri]|uniref:Uncharacterized protein n=1 Tax=Haloferax marisrubri TaxID=1544719 RepID=A0A2P4NUC7_9EURY|nr:hypothetical protein [Haloferax marisrubri]POG56764.1 hypothetical protein AUR65_002760 [Haloferax marisrubri]
MDSTLEIFSDEEVEALWFKGLDDRLLEVDHRIMSGSLPDYIEELLAYDRPDIIVAVDEEPVLVVEKSGEVPSGHNMGQRFGRMVRAAEHDVPSIMFFPYLAMKHGTHAGLCYANARYFTAMWEVSRIHDAPFWSVNWPCDDDGELVNDGTEDELLSRFVTEFIDNGFEVEGMSVAEEVKSEMQWGYDRSVDGHPKYESLPRSVKIRDTEAVVAEWEDERGSVDLPEKFFDRDETLVYKVGMSPENCRREDPYAGMQFVYDYGWCREGPDPSEKHRNLVINVPKVTRETWTEKNPNDPSRKSSQWYATAEAFALKDGVISDFSAL